jgi:hypothetical protein
MLAGGVSPGNQFNWTREPSGQREDDMNQPSPKMIAGTNGEDMILALCGFVTSLVTAVILWWVELGLGVAFYSWILWFILPVGAMVSGFAGASGYYAGARILGRRPTRLLLLNILLASVGTFFTIHYLSYITLEFEGKAIRDYVSFWRYLDVAIRSTSMTFRLPATGSTGELGAFGYVVAILQVLGFALGGYGVYFYLVSLPYCQRCSRYFSKKGKQIRYTGDAEAMQATTVQVLKDFGDGSVTSAIEKHRAFGKPAFQKGALLRKLYRVE